MPPPFTALLRFWHTIRWLKPVQIYGRIWHRLHRPHPDLSAAPSHRHAVQPWQPCRRAPSMAGPRTARFLNEERTLEPGEWDNPAWPLLWRYHLHYFDDLNATDATQRKDWHAHLIDDWLAHNPPATGTGWDAYPTSLRIVNWLQYALGQGELGDQAWHSLAIQTRWLSRRLEYHLLGNHLWANAKALTFAGSVFQGDEAQRWLQLGSGLLLRELDEQFLADGGHFELSPMYHATLTADALDLLQLERCLPNSLPAALLEQLRQRMPSMLDWLATMTHPDGDIAFFNDTTFGMAPTLADLTAYARTLGVSPPSSPATFTPLNASGYVRAQRGPATLIADLAAVGPDYLPGHAHADTLSFELSIHAQRIIVNSGVSTYAVGTTRSAERGTAAHSTVIVDGKNSSEVWGSFRVGRRARILERDWHASGERCVIEGTHDGYRQIARGPLHRRRWVLDDQSLQIEDQLRGSFTLAEARLILHPDVSATPDGNDILLRSRQATLRLRTSGPQPTLVKATWAPGFGRLEATQAVCLALPADGQLSYRLEWNAT